MPNGTTPVRFAVQTEFGMYRDCLYYADDVYATLNYEDVEAEKQRRVDNFVSTMKEMRDNPPKVELDEEKFNAK